MPNPRNFNVLPGARIDPSDVDTTDEELEAMAVRLGEAIMIIDTQYEPFKRLDQNMIMLRNSLDLIMELAENGGRKSLAELVDESIKEYIKLVEHGAPVAEYKFDSDYMHAALKLLKKLMFDNASQLVHELPGVEWGVAGIKDTVLQAVAHANEVLRLLLPDQLGDEPGDRRHRIEAYLDKACEEIDLLSVNPEFD